MIYADVLLLGSGQGLFLSLLLLRTTTGNAAALRLLSILTFSFSIDLAVSYLGVTGLTLRHPRLVFIEVLVVYLYGPLLYLYVVALTAGPSWRVSARQWLHFVPFFAALPLLLPAFRLDEAVLRSLLSGSVTVRGALGAWTPVFEIVDLVPRILIGVYLALGFHQLARHSRTIRDRYSRIEHISLHWLRNLLLGIAGLYILYFLAFAIGDTGSIDKLLNLTTAIVVYTLGYLGLRQPAIFTQDDPVHEADPSPGTPSSATDSGESKPKYEGSALDAASARSLLQDLEQLMSTERPFLEADLTLRELATRLRLPPNYLSQVINQQAGCNFFDFINGYRVQAAKDALADPENQTANILTLAMDAGFNSKSAFYTAFKQHTGMTPTQYRKTTAS